MSELPPELVLSQPRRHDEDRLQRAVVQYLRWSAPADATWYAIPNGGARSKIEAGRLIGLGVRAGIPDLGLVWRGLPIFIELKTETGRLSAHQVQMHERLRGSKAHVAVCRSLPEVERELRELGMPLQALLTPF